MVSKVTQKKRKEWNESQTYKCYKDECVDNIYNQILRNENKKVCDGRGLQTSNISIEFVHDNDFQLTT